MSREKRANLVGCTWDSEDVEFATDNGTTNLGERTISYIRHPDGRIARIRLENRQGEHIAMELDEPLARAIAAVFDQPVEGPHEDTLEDLLDSMPDD